MAYENSLEAIPPAGGNTFREKGEKTYYRINGLTNGKTKSDFHNVIKGDVEMRIWITIFCLICLASPVSGKMMFKLTEPNVEQESGEEINYESVENDVSTYDSVDDPTEEEIIASRQFAVKHLIGQGINDVEVILNLLNFNKDGELTGDFTLNEVGQYSLELYINQYNKNLNISSNAFGVDNSEIGLENNPEIKDIEDGVFLEERPLERIIRTPNIETNIKGDTEVKRRKNRLWFLLPLLLF